MSNDETRIAREGAVARAVPVRLLRAAMAVQWAMSPQWLSTLLSIAKREGAGSGAVAAELGRDLDNTQTATVRSGVALIPVVGPIFRRANFFTDVSGATSTEILACDLRAAMENDEVHSILLDVDSPGGEASGVHELAAMIFAMRGKKPIVAYAGGTCASAAYWLAAACDRVVIDATGIAGSIGVVTAVQDPAKDESGEIEIVSSGAPNKRPNIATDEGRATVQTMVDALADVFVSDVARYRGVTPEKVLSDFGAGGVLVGAAAVAAGMADELGSLEGTIAKLSGAATLAKPKPNSSAARAATLTTKPRAQRGGATTMTVRADDAPAPATEPAEDDKEKGAAAPATEAPATDPAAQTCAKRNAVGAGSAKFCAGCGAAYPEKDPEDDDDEPPSSEDPDAVVAGIKGVTGAKTGRKAVATAMGWKRVATIDMPRLRAENVDLRIGGLKAAGKCTPPLERDLRSLASLDHGSFTAAAQNLELGKPIDGLLPQTREPKVDTASTLGGLTHNGKSFEAMSFTEQASLYDVDRTKYEAMRADAVRRGADITKTAKAASAK